MKDKGRKEVEREGKKRNEGKN